MSKTEILETQQLLPLSKIEDEYEIPADEIRAAVRQKKLKALVKGRRVHVRRIELERWLEATYG